MTMTEAYEQLRTLYPREFLRISAHITCFPGDPASIVFTSSVGPETNYSSLDSLMRGVLDSARSIAERAEAIA